MEQTSRYPAVHRDSNNIPGRTTEFRQVSLYSSSHEQSNPSRPRIETMQVNHVSLTSLPRRPIDDMKMSLNMLQMVLFVYILIL